MLVKGFDTETTSDGKARIVATDTEAILVDSFEEIAEFLRPPKTGKRPIYECWNMDYDARAILKWLPPNIWWNWYTSDSNVTTFNDYAIKYIPTKKFCIGYKMRKGYTCYTWTTIYDIAQFYGHDSLNHAAKQYLGKEKMDLAGWVETVNTYQDVERELKYLKKHRGQIKFYCIRDAALTKELAEFMFDSLEKIGAPTKNPISPASIAGKVIQARVADYSKSACGEEHWVMQQTFRGGLFLTLKRGVFDCPIYEYDISSAYPAVIKDLPHWFNGDFEISADENEIWDSEYGWVYATFDCPWIPYTVDFPLEFEEAIGDGEFQWIHTSNTTNMYPTGLRRQPITLAEAKWMRKHGFPIKIDVGVIWNQSSDKYPEKPFAFVQEMFDERQRIISEFGKKDMRQYAIKIMLNSMYGKMVQSPEKYGFRAPTVHYGYGSYITALTRLQVAEVVLNHPGKVIEIATDAVLLLEKAPELPTPEEKTLGTWELTEFAGGVFVANGVKQLFRDRDWTDGTTKARGLTNNRTYNLFEELYKHVMEDTLVFTKVRPITVSEVLRTYNNKEKFHPEWMNRFLPVHRRLRLDSANKLRWEWYPKNWKEFLTNGPIDGRFWTIDEVQKGIYKKTPQEILQESEYAIR